MHRALEKWHILVKKYFEIIDLVKKESYNVSPFKVND